MAGRSPGTRELDVFFSVPVGYWSKRHITAFPRMVVDLDEDLFCGFDEKSEALATDHGLTVDDMFFDNKYDLDADIRDRCVPLPQ